MIGVISDLHLKENLGYADYVADRRIPEKQEILDFIVANLKDCQHIVLIGDQFNARNNPSSIIKEFVSFIERFDNKQHLYILAGNHEKTGCGKSALDFLKEIKQKNWTVITNDISEVDISEKLSFVFCPYFTKSELEVNTFDEGTKKVMGFLTKAIKDKTKKHILFAHYCLTNTTTTSGVQTNIFDDIVLDSKKLTSLYSMVVAGHVHNPHDWEELIVTGSIFNNEIGETQKYIWKINEKDLTHEKIALPGRGIYKLENPTLTDLNKIKANNIVKVLITRKHTQAELVELKKKLKKFDAYVLLEQIPKERKKLHYGEGESILEFDVEKLLEIYAKEHKIDYNKLKTGFELIK